MENEYSIALMIKMIDTIFETETNKELSKLELTHSQLEMLIYIRTRTDRGIEVNQIDLEKYFNLKNPTVTGILNRLEDKGYIKRIASIKNARFKKIIVTEKAKEILNKGKEKAENLEEKLMNCLSDKEKQELRNMLDKIIKNTI